MSIATDYSLSFSVVLYNWTSAWCNKQTVINVKMLHVHHDVMTWKRFQHHSRRVNGTVYPKKYAHGFVVLCFVVVTQSFKMNSHEVFIHIHQGCFAGTGAIVRLPQCQWSKPDGYGKISQCITTTKHSKAKTVCIFLGIYCRLFSHKGRNADLLRFVWHGHAQAVVQTAGCAMIGTTWCFVRKSCIRW